MHILVLQVNEYFSKDISKLSYSIVVYFVAKEAEALTQFHLNIWKHLLYSKDVVPVNQYYQ